MLGVGFSFSFSFLFFFPSVFQGHFFYFFWLPLHQEASALKNNFCMRDEQRSINSRDVDLVAQVDDHTNLIAWLTPRLIFFISSSSECWGCVLYIFFSFSITFLLAFRLFCLRVALHTRLNLDGLSNIRSNILS